ncbi:protein FD-like [Canna indica]|uniref:Protein FD-like n=1 Tax=Canna indica TaxID=4628 RepID=A0AAQ3KH40_9LILI|nr:protein FD-like [Canna indica]
MWSLELQEYTNHKNWCSSNTGLYSSNTSVLIERSLPRPYMEELWEDITLTILHQERSIIAPRSTTTTLQDFLSGPVIAPPPPHVEQVLPLRAPPSPPALSLNTSMTNNTYYDYTPDAHGHNAYFLAGAGPPSPAELTSFCSKKRMPENTANGSDRHFRRMIKNREAAARSRARKQALNFLSSP